MGGPNTTYMTGTLEAIAKGIKSIGKLKRWGICIGNWKAERWE